VNHPFLGREQGGDKMRTGAGLNISSALLRLEVPRPRDLLTAQLRFQLTREHTELCADKAVVTSVHASLPPGFSNDLSQCAEQFFGALQRYMEPDFCQCDRVSTLVTTAHFVLFNTERRYDNAK
jgi:hypothetical protein